MQKRQEAFLSALIRDPSLAENVKIFSWTLLLLDSNRRTHLGIDPFEVHQSVALDPESPFNEIWNVFASLTSVQTLDLAWLSRHLAMPLAHNIPSTLFPAATSVRLAGVMPYTLAASILLTKPRNLLHLDLDNLHQSGKIPSTHLDWDSEMDDDYCWIYGQSTKINQVLNLVLLRNACNDYLDDTLPLEDLVEEMALKLVCRIKTQSAAPIPVHIPAPRHCQTPRPWNNLAHFEDDSEYFSELGPMQNLLGALAGKCTSLQSLHLRKGGARDQFDFSPHLSSKEHDIYAEWAIFLTSVKPTLESLVFEQGERLLPRADWVQPLVRPMDQLFGDVLFPVLVGGGWARMKKVVVRGVQQWEKGGGQGNGDMVLLDGRGELRGAFGEGVEVMVERRAREADHMGAGYECGGGVQNV
ncbi:hypothetical protein IMSHALPRED_005745 [Imshaugia aleurites]|uniref:Uncharacterized protein n=1 Tax=Imshaugia aleurites TaxID=172621 RepID=A0A8H3FFU8_9LECA|nr:hypothetical protein IMSHALPRED_005745 [Imshaugia aleurites]